MGVTEDQEEEDDEEEQPRVWIEDSTRKNEVTEQYGGHTSIIAWKTIISKMAPVLGLYCSDQ